MAQKLVWKDVMMAASIYSGGVVLANPLLNLGNEVAYKRKWIDAFDRRINRKYIPIGSGIWPLWPLLVPATLGVAASTIGDRAGTAVQALFANEKQQ